MAYYRGARTTVLCPPPLPKPFKYGYIPEDEKFLLHKSHTVDGREYLPISHESDKDCSVWIVILNGNRVVACDSAQFRPITCPQKNVDFRSFKVNTEKLPQLSQSDLPVTSLTKDAFIDLMKKERLYCLNNQTAPFGRFCYEDEAAGLIYMYDELDRSKGLRRFFGSGSPKDWVKTMILQIARGRPELLESDISALTEEDWEKYIFPAAAKETFDLSFPTATVEDSRTARSCMQLGEEGKANGLKPGQTSAGTIAAVEKGSGITSKNPKKKKKKKKKKAKVSSDGLQEPITEGDVGSEPKKEDKAFGEVKKEVLPELSQVVKGEDEEAKYPLEDPKDPRLELSQVVKKEVVKAETPVRGEKEEQSNRVQVTLREVRFKRQLEDYIANIVVESFKIVGQELPLHVAKDAASGAIEDKKALLPRAIREVKFKRQLEYFIAKVIAEGHRMAGIQEKQIPIQFARYVASGMEPEWAAKKFEIGEVISYSFHSVESVVKIKDEKYLAGEKEILFTPEKFIEAPLVESGSVIPEIVAYTAEVSKEPNVLNELEVPMFVPQILESGEVFDTKLEAAIQNRFKICTIEQYAEELSPKLGSVIQENVAYTALISEEPNVESKVVITKPEILDSFHVKEQIKTPLEEPAKEAVETHQVDSNIAEQLADKISFESVSAIHEVPTFLALPSTAAQMYNVTVTEAKVTVAEEVTLEYDVMKIFNDVKESDPEIQRVADMLQLGPSTGEDEYSVRNILHRNIDNQIPVDPEAMDMLKDGSDETIFDFDNEMAKKIAIDAASQGATAATTEVATSAVNAIQKIAESSCNDDIIVPIYAIDFDKCNSNEFLSDVPASEELVTDAKKKKVGIFKKFRKSVMKKLRRILRRKQ